MQNMLFSLIFFSGIIGNWGFNFTFKLPPGINLTKLEENLFAEEWNLTTPETIVKYGFSAEIHNVTTDDGYILQMHRITNVTGPPVLIQHGLECSSFDWIVLGPNNSIAYMLAKNGYDVWLGNFRGNVYSQKHISLSTSNKKFWDFSFDENAHYDLPAEISYILKTTGSSNLSYIGHSMGTTSYLAMGTYRQDIIQKVKVALLLAPAAYMDHAISPVFKLFGSMISSVTTTELTEILGNSNIEPNPTAMALLGQQFCGDDDISQFLCTNLLFLIFGFDKDNLETSKLPLLMAHYPAGASTKQLFHYLQEVNSKLFRKYDYYAQNIFNYIPPVPPNYDLSKVTSPVVLFYAENDWVSAETDVLRLAVQLPNATLHKVADPKFNHIDHIYGKNATTVLHPYIMEMLEKYN